MSAIDTTSLDITKPIASVQVGSTWQHPTTQSVRDNFSVIKTALNAAKSEIESLSAGAGSASSHIAASTGVHGVSGAVVGTTDVQGISNKTITASSFDSGGLTASASLVKAVLVNATLFTGANFAGGYSTTVTAAGTTTLTAASNHHQFFTGTATQTVALPVTSTLTTGHSYRITNLSTGAVTVNSSGGNLVSTVNAGATVLVTCILADGTTTAAAWSGDRNLQGSTSGNLFRGFMYYITRVSATEMNITCYQAGGTGFNAAANITATNSGTIAKGGNATVGSGATAVTFSLNAGGTQVTIDLVETITNVFGPASVHYTNQGTAITCAASISGGNLTLDFFNAATGAAYDVCASAGIVQGQVVVVIGGGA